MEKVTEIYNIECSSQLPYKPLYFTQDSWPNLPKMHLMPGLFRSQDNLRPSLQAGRVTQVLGLPWHSHISYFQRRIFKIARLRVTLALG